MRTNIADSEKVVLMQNALKKAAPLAVLASMIWLAPGCGGDEGSDDGSAGNAGTNVVGGATGDGGEPASSSGGTSGTGTDTGGASGAGARPPEPLDCLGEPLPETVPDNVVLSGLVTTWSNVIIDGAEVEALAVSDDGLLSDDTSALNGSYELTVPTGGAPLDAYLRVSAEGSVDSYVYPPMPFVADDEPDLSLITADLRAGVADEAGVSLEADKGLLYVLVLDCNGDPVEGATVTTNPPGEQLSYTEGFVPSPDRTSTDGSGAAYIFNLPPGDVEVHATVDGYALREHTIEVRADVMTISSVIP
jgi:hypothetical protein